MLEQINLQAVLVPLVCFLAGWLLAKMSRRGNKAEDADPRDSEIRSLQATVRVHKADLHKVKSDSNAAKEGLEDAQKMIETLQRKLKERRNELDIMKLDRKAALEKTRELRTELQSRALEFNLAKARIGELETEISVARASKDLNVGSGTSG
jgi:chromosome segregation ATPase